MFTLHEDKILGGVIGLIVGFVVGVIGTSVMADHKLKILMTGPKHTIEEVRSNWLRLEELDKDQKITRENLGNALKSAGY